MTTKKINKGFTLIEVLLVMVLIGVLLSIGLVSLNTEDRLIETRNNTRQTHIQTLESAITQYKLQEGNYPTGLNRNYQEICDPEATVCTGFFDIKPFLVPTYIQAIPQDPNDSDTTGGSGYEVAVDIATNTVSVRLKATLQESGVEIKINDPLPAEPTVTANTQLAATVPNLPPTSTPTVYAIGDTGPGGGKVFYVAGNTYLEAAPSNWSGGTDPGLTWSTGGNQTTVVSGADNSAIGGGFQNTVDIVNQAGNVTASSAAVRARNYTGGGMTDWFLPSKDELAALYAQRTTTGIPTGVVYWSSSELSSTNAWLLWDNGVFVTNAGKDWTGRVRPIRMGVIQTTPTVTATGGNITTINQNGTWYKVHTFTTSGTFTVTNGGNVEYLVVGGGGSGGNRGGGAGGGGGGAGGFRTGTGLAVTPQAYPITVGAGGTAVGDNSVSGNSGNPSGFSTITSAGGGSGGKYGTSGDGGTGGSGGGGGRDNGGQGSAGNVPSTSPSQGNAGGNSGSGGAGGGGGAGAVGSVGASNVGGAGGAGTVSSISGAPVTYAGGGGGGAQNSGGTGGSGIGGNGGYDSNNAGTAGMVNTGSGGGGGGSGAGGSGVVIIRYQTPAPTTVQNGLVLHLDAGNTSSYPGTGTTWTDLSGNGNNLTAINSPTWNSSGYFSTGATGYFSGSGTASIPIGNSNYTMMAWVRQNSSWGSRRGIISIGGFGSQNVSNALRTDDNTNVGNFLHWWYGNDLSVANNNAGLSVGTWFMVTAQFDGTNRRVWANTTNVGSNTPGSSHNVLTTAVMVGATPDGNSLFQGDVAQALIYNRALTAEEIQQNFNANKGRFGL